MKPRSMPKASLKTFASGARQFVVHDAFEMMTSVSGLYVVLVDAHDDRRVVAGGGSGDEDLLGAAGDVLLGVLGLGEAAGRLDDDVDAELAPGEVGGVALFEDLDGLAADGDRVVVVRDVVAQRAADGVVLEQVGEGLVVGEVVHRHDFEVRALRESRAKVVASDAAEAVDSDLDSHGISPECVVRECAVGAFQTMDNGVPAGGPAGTPTLAMTVPAGPRSSHGRP